MIGQEIDELADVRDAGHVFQGGRAPRAAVTAARVRQGAQDAGADLWFDRPPRQKRKPEPTSSLLLSPHPPPVPTPAVPLRQAAPPPCDQRHSQPPPQPHPSFYPTL